MVAGFPAETKIPSSANSLCVIQLKPRCSQTCGGAITLNDFEGVSRNNHMRQLLTRRPYLVSVEHLRPVAIVVNEPKLN